MESLSRKVTIVNELGLHARSAGKIAAIAKDSPSRVWIIKAGEAADASSIIDMLTLACEKGSEITIKIDDIAALGTLNSIAALVEQGFGE